MRGRRAAGAALTAVTIWGLVACTPEPAPSPTPTGFASEDEAFRAAETTYRAYVDALNDVDLSDPATFEPVYAWLTNDALADEKRSLTKMHSEGWSVSGSSVVTKVEGTDSSGLLVASVACLRVDTIELVDSQGQSQVRPDRPDVYALELEFEHSTQTPTGLRISRSNAVTDERCT